VVTTCLSWWSRWFNSFIGWCFFIMRPFFPMLGGSRRMLCINSPMLPLLSGGPAAGLEGAVWLKLRVVEALTLGTDGVRSAQEAFCELPGQGCVNGLLTALCVLKTRWDLQHACLFVLR